ncbi:MAG: 50S ribosomal protein L21 [Deltaproteobacteria bacterium]|nr:50S ribosomal protein L21 [Deltaproteobacteria bacterium]
MYAVIETGGKQYKVELGKRYLVEKLAGSSGDTVELGRVLFIGGQESVAVGTPIVEGAYVECKILDQEKGKKLIIFKYKRRKRYRKKQGHRQNLTHLEVLGIHASGASKRKEALVKVPVQESSSVEVENETSVKKSKKKLVAKASVVKSKAGVLKKKVPLKKKTKLKEKE